MRFTRSYPSISTEIPVSTQEIPRVEPRLYFDDTGADRNPFQLASDWAPMTPEPLDAPAPEPSRWFLLPLGKSPNPLDVGFSYVESLPAEVKPEEGSGEAEKAGKEAPGADEKKAAPQPAPAPGPEKAAGKAGPDSKSLRSRIQDRGGRGKG